MELEEDLCRQNNKQNSRTTNRTKEQQTEQYSIEQMVSLRDMSYLIKSFNRWEKEVGVKGYQFSNFHYGNPKKCAARQTKCIHSLKAVNKLCRGIRFYTKMHLFSHCAVVSMIYHGPMLALPHLFLANFAP